METKTIKIDTGGGTRNYSIDLLKIILAILIVMNHSIGHGIKQLDYTIYENNRTVLNVIWAFANPAVNIFFIISGYFGIKRTKKSGIYLLSSMFVITCAVGTCSYILGEMSLLSLVKDVVLPWTNWWFMTVYMIIWILSPYINLALGSLTSKQLKNLVIILLVITFFQGFLFNGALWGNGFSVSHCVTMYILGSYISRNDNLILEHNASYKKRLSILIYISSSVFEYLLYEFGCHMNMTGITDRVGSYACPIVIIQSISLFIVFLNLNSKLINVIGKTRVYSILKSCVLPVYLISDYGGIRNHIFRPLIGIIKLTDTVVPVLVLYAITCIILTMPISMLLNKIIDIISSKFIWRK